MQVDMIPGQGHIAQESCLDRTAIMKGIIYWISNAYMHAYTNKHTFWNLHQNHTDTAYCLNSYFQNIKILHSYRDCVSMMLPISYLLVEFFWERKKKSHYVCLHLHHFQVSQLYIGHKNIAKNYMVYIKVNYWYKLKS